MSEANYLVQLSNSLVSAVAKAGPSVVRVDDHSRLTASGVVWSSDGIVVATSHGVESDDNLEVELSDGARLSASVLVRDNDSDLAVLRLLGSGLPEIEKVAGSELSVGQFALALGRPGERGLQATFGVVGSTRDARTPSGVGKVIHTDATLYPGFSGGALVDASGRFLGLLNLGHRRSWGVALGTEVVQEVVDAALSGGTLQRAYLGVRAQPVTINRESGPQTGLLVAFVEANSAAERAGLRPGDIILELGGKAMEDSRELRKTLRGFRAGQEVVIELLRGDERKSVTVTLGPVE